MAFPTLEKSWQFTTATGVSTLNKQIKPINATYERRTVLVEIVKALTSFQYNPWTVKACCYYDGSSWVVDTSGVNRWLYYWNLGWADSRYGGSRSWIVLHNPAHNYDIWFDCYIYLTIDNQMQIKWSPGALYMQPGDPTPTPTSPPSASDAITLRADSGTWIDSRSQWGYPSYYYLNVMHSTDGRSTRVCVYSYDLRPSVWLFEDLADPVGSWDWPYLIYPPDYENQLDWQSISNTGFSMNKFWCKKGGTVLRPSCSTEVCYDTAGSPYDAAISQAVQGTLSNITRMYGAQPIGLWSNAYGFRGRLGRFYDLWVGSQLMDDGVTYTADGRTFAQWGHLIVPWQYGLHCQTS